MPMAKRGNINMYNQFIMGRPKKCINRTCKGKFFKESFLGHIPKNESEVYCIMKCPICDDTFAIVQPISIIRGYVAELPSKPKTNRANAPIISTEEINSVSKTMNEVNILSTLIDEGMM